MNKKILIPEGYEFDKVENDVIVLKEIFDIEKLPNSWEEWVEQHKDCGCEYYIGVCGGIMESVSTVERNVGNVAFLPEKETAESVAAFIQLLRLRDAYRCGWKPNFHNEKYSIYVDSFGEIAKMDNCMCDFMCFQTGAVRDKFYDNFRELIKKIVPLYL